jgi:uncharacterized protein (DUF2236 family)
VTSAPESFQRHREAVRARLLQADHVPAGPGSISWRINREIVVVAGWGRAILLQVAHPSIAAGVHDHSAVRGSLLSSYRRFRSTVGAMLSLTFGDTEQMIAAAAGINAIHDRVRGRVPPSPGLRGASDGEYSAHDPDLQRWVHVTLLDSILLTYEQLVAPLSQHERDTYCAEAAIMEPLLGMPAGWLPRTTAQLDACMRDTLASGRIAVTGTSRALARTVLYPPRWYMAWPVFRAMQAITIGSLPPQIREAYGFEWRASDVRALARWIAIVRMLRRLVPAVAREWPAARAASSPLDFARGRPLDSARGQRAKADARLDAVDDLVWRRGAGR